MTKKTLVVMLAALLALVMLGGIVVRIRNSGKSSGKDESSTIELTQAIIIPSEMPVNISIPIPAGFSETSSETFDKYYVRDDATIIITGETFPVQAKPLDEYTQSVLAQYEKSIDDFRLINNTEYDSGAPCRVLEFTYALIGEDARQDYQCITAVLIKDNCSYIVTCKSKKENFDAYRGVFLMMIGKITIADAAPDPLQGTEPAAVDGTDFVADFSGTAP
ncbi:MAG: hypothetical protein IJ060_08905 [Oscillospiraceae bacterium]|nr:hypothetical protein [Oscillospiraceae bacterium]